MQSRSIVHVPCPSSGSTVEQDPDDPARLVLIQNVSDPDGTSSDVLVGWVSLRSLASESVGHIQKDQRTRITITDSEAHSVDTRTIPTGPAVESALLGHSGIAEFQNDAGETIISAYRWLPDLGVAIIAEQAKIDALAPMETVSATLIAAALIAALVSAVIAAFVTRHFTRPIVRLTELALAIASGDLTQRVPVTARDEIGILSTVFNQMAAELASLYADLEAKVAERTSLLQEANQRLHRHAVQLNAAVEVSHAATSVLDAPKLLNQVVRLIQEGFAYRFAGILLPGDGEGNGATELRFAASWGDSPISRPRSQHVAHHEAGAVWESARTGEPVSRRVVTNTAGDEAGDTDSQLDIRWEIALPLKHGTTVTGILQIVSGDSREFDADDVSILQGMAGQIAIALENARAYALEREAALRLRELDRSKRRFLTNMSHEFRTPLTNVIGFSRLLLKKLDGPLNHAQVRDIEIIYQDGQHLLGLINDLLDISHIEAGMMELDLRETALPELIDSVMATVKALIGDKPIQLLREMEADTPLVLADGARIRQVLLKLLSNAARCTEQGTITVGCRRKRDFVLVSVADTGSGIAPRDQVRIFDRFEQVPLGQDRPGAGQGVAGGAGIGLALSKEMVELHGGTLSVESQLGRGATFTLSLPVADRTRRTCRPEQTEHLSLATEATAK